MVFNRIMEINVANGLAVSANLWLSMSVCLYIMILE